LVPMPSSLMYFIPFLEDYFIYPLLEEKAYSKHG
jgi:hypothetical protein